MHTLPVTYENPDGEMVTETFYFNMNKAELIELEMKHPGGFASYLQSIISSNDGNVIIQTFKDLILMSYGVKNGNDFDKEDPETGVPYRNRFEKTLAFAELWSSMATSAELGAEFVNQVVPKAMKLTPEELARGQERMEQLQAAGAPISPTSSDEDTAGTPEDLRKNWKEFTEEELLAMDNARFNKIAGPQNKWPRDLLLIAFKRKS